MSVSLLGALGAILGASFFVLFGYIGRVLLERGAPDAERSPCTDEIYANLEALTLRTDKLRDDVQDVRGTVQEAMHGFRLVRQEWDDAYSKMRAIEERTRKRVQRQRAREGDDGDGDDDAVRAAMEAGNGVAPQGTGKTGDQGELQYVPTQEEMQRLAFEIRHGRGS